MADKPTSVRIPKALRLKLKKAAARSNTPATDILILGLAKFLDEHRTAEAIIDAVVRNRQATVS